MLHINNPLLDIRYLHLVRFVLGTCSTTMKTQKIQLALTLFYEIISIVLKILVYLRQACLTFTN